MCCSIPTAPPGVTIPRGKSSKSRKYRSCWIIAPNNREEFIDRTCALLEARGPLTGKELLELTGLDEFTLWSACSRSDQIITRIIGRRYLRLDRQVENYARLSPSIMREFYGYTVIGVAGHGGEVDRKAAVLEKEIALISQKKFELARKTVAGLVEARDDAELIKEAACFMIAGDVVYAMAHAEPRPESSTGELVLGSDLDLVIVTGDLPEPVVRTLDAAVYDEKYRLLTNPSCKEEIDYIIKDISRVREQLRLENFKSMVAAKILDEARLLYGSAAIFEQIKEMLREKGIPGTMRSLEKQAHINRKKAESYLLAKTADLVTEEESMKLFHTAGEREEIF